MGSQDRLYQELLIERARNPRHAGRPDGADLHGHGENPLCGDRVEIFVRRGSAEIGHETQGCAILLASADLMADAVRGAGPAQIAKLRAAFEAVVATGVEDPALGALNALAGVSEYRSRIRCATLPWTALARALEEAE